MYTRYQIKNIESLNWVYEEIFLKSPNKVIAFDTETNGLNIIQSKPFMIQCAIDNYSFYFRLEYLDGNLTEMSLNMLVLLLDMFEKAEIVVAANTKFDLNMLCNIGANILEAPVGTYKFTDVLVMARLIVPADYDGIKQFSLKGLATKFLSADSKIDADAVAIEFKKLIAMNNKLRSSHVKKKIGITFPELEKHIYEPALNNSKEYDQLYENVIRLFPSPTYADIDDEIMNSYGTKDAEMTLDLYKAFLDLIKNRGNINTYELENNAIIPLLELERTGFNIDLNYVKACQINVANEYQYTIKQLKLTIMNSMKKLEVNLNNVLDLIKKTDQSEKAFKKLIKDNPQYNELLTVINNIYYKNITNNRVIIMYYFKLNGHPIESTGKDVLKDIANKYNTSEEIKDFIKLLSHSRTMAKWYSTYLSKYVKEHTDGRFYISLKQCDTVTGRMSSNFHQFPKYPINSIKDNSELFSPRKIVTVDKDKNYNSIYYFDYSQIELRIQAHFTLDWLGGDLNLCRAFMPFKCYEENGVWKKEENGELWSPVDLHSLTTSKAFPDVDVNSEEFKKLRNYGKTTNFAKNYGGGYKSLEGLLGGVLTETQLNALNTGYGEAFPKVAEYGKKISEKLVLYKYVETLNSRKFYGESYRQFYKFNNYVIQGSGADLIKLALIETHKFLRRNHLKTKVQMCIHDEISFLVYAGEEALIEKYIKGIMEYNYLNMKIPVVCDVEKTTTTWADKYDVEVAQ